MSRVGKRVILKVFLRSISQSRINRENRMNKGKFSIRQRIRAGILSAGIVLAGCLTGGRTILTEKASAVVVPAGTWQAQEGASATDAAELTSESATEEQSPAEITEDVASAGDPAEAESAAFKIQYLVTENSYVETPDKQFVLTEIGDGTKKLVSAELSWVNETTGATGKTAADTVLDTTALFYLNFSSEADTGKYRLASMTYSFEDGTVFTEDLAAIGLASEFGVNQEVSADPDLWLDETDSQGNGGTGESSADISITSGGTSTDVKNTLAAAEQSLGQAKVSGSSAVNGTSSSGNHVIVIDPGHGGVDSGCYNTYNGVRVYEKNLTMKIARYMKAELEKYPNYTVYLTRDGDNVHSSNSSAELTWRADYAASVKADAFISIHINSVGSENNRTTANGVEVYVPNQNYNAEVAKAGNDIGSKVLNRLTALGLNKRGLKIRNSESGSKYPDGSSSDYYAVIRQNKTRGIPAIIVEHGFLDNASDYEKYFSTDAALQRLGIADAQGVVDYFGVSHENATNLNGVDYTSVYNYDYYVAHNREDLTAAGVNISNSEAVLRYFVSTGMKKGQRASAYFDVKSYQNLYPDLRTAFLNDLPQYYLHYCRSGKKEGRTATGTEHRVGYITKWKGVDYSPVYNETEYLNRYPDLRAAFGEDDIQVLQHFVYCGMKEGRQGSSTFDVKSYRRQYADLRRAFGNEWQKYYLHYLTSGIREHRKTTGCTTLQNPVTVYNGVDYRPVYDYSEYQSMYADIRKTYGEDDYRTLEHFVLCGMREGRRGNRTFDVKAYLNRYPDLRNAFGNNYQKAYEHYLTSGIREKRRGGPLATVNGYVSEMNGVDYSLVYDGKYYHDHYPDLAKAYGTDGTRLLEHFVYCGMREGRQGNAAFNVVSYLYQYPDLRRAFGTDFSKYYLHYCTSGAREHRIAKGVTTMQKPLTSMNGVDYSRVYDFHDYISIYPDLAARYRYDDKGALSHYLAFGIREKRYGKKWVHYEDVYRTNSHTDRAFVITVLQEQGYSNAGIAGILGSLWAESGINSINLENSYNAYLKNAGYSYWSDEEFTKAVDNGTVSREDFIDQGAAHAKAAGLAGYGYGLAQWTYYSRKAALYDYAKSMNTSIGDLYMQTRFLACELSALTNLNTLLKTTSSVQEATDEFFGNFEYGATRYQQDKGTDKLNAYLIPRRNYANQIYQTYFANAGNGK